jgi:mono/diheme cytochrome c family protein
VLLGLSTGNAVGLALVAGIFVAFAIVSALVIPRRWPDFPGRHLGWFVAATLVLFVATLGAVEVFAKESEEPEAAETTQTEPPPPPPGTGTTTQAEPPPAQGDPAAGEALFEAQGCGGCHAFSAAGTTASVGPDLDEALQGKDAEFVQESIVDPNKEVASGFAPNVMPQTYDSLSDEQLDDLVAFLTTSS